MDPITRQAIAVAGGAGGGDPLYVDDVFSTTVYDGTGSGASPATGQTINNGIDLSGEGGLVWSKNRDYAYPHMLFDTARGVQKYLISNESYAEGTHDNGISSFNSNGYTMGTMAQINEGTTNYEEHVSWTFRKAPGFFDVVTYTGNGVNGRQISHSLGSTPGMSIIKCTTTSARDWIVRHQDMSSGKVCFLNTTDSELTNPGGYQTHSSTHLTLNSGSAGLQGVNNSGDTYVAYIFAHDDQSFGTNEDEAIIKCGSYTGNGSSTGPVIDLGFEPQWVMIKSASTTGDWGMVDVMRGQGVDSSSSKKFLANTNYSEGPSNFIKLTPTGFQLTVSVADINGNNHNYIYMAIRRPNKPPTAGTEVFAIDTYGGILPNPPGFNAGFTVDAAFSMQTASGDTQLCSRLTDQRRIYTNLTSAEDDNATNAFDYQDGWNASTAVTTGYVSWMFRRAPGFIDVVGYTGTGSARTVNHNLTVAPELLIVKCRTNNGQWAVYNAIDGASKALTISITGIFTFNPYWNSTAPTATQFTVATDGAVNANTQTYIAYLFATLDGISKVGSYTGTGYDVNVDCGFAAGARFILIKRTDSTGDWYVWDTLRGIGTGNDPYKLLNSLAAQVTNTDYVDPLNAGFTVTSSAPAALNASGGTYLFLAIA